MYKIRGILMFYVMLHVMFLMFSVVFLVDEVQRTSGNQSKRVLARDDGATMTTVDGINIAYFQGPNSLKVLSNRRRSIYLRPPAHQFQCCKWARYCRACSVLCMQYIFRTDRGYLKDAAPRNPHFASRATLKLGGKGGGELNLEPQTDEPKEKQVVNICNIYSVHRWGPQISFGF